MKKVFFLLSFVLLIGLTTNAQKNVITTNPLALALGDVNLGYERALNSSSSVLIGGEYINNMLGVDVKMGELNLGYRYYFTHIKKEVPRGLYISPQASIGLGKLSDQNATLLGAGAELGHQWIWSGFTLNLGVGVFYYNLECIKENETTRYYGLIPGLNVSVGYAF